MQKKDYTVPIIVVVGLFVLTLLLIANVVPKNNVIISVPKDSLVNGTYSPGPVPYAGRDHVFSLDQIVAQQITVATASLKENGFVVVHQESETGGLGDVIGASQMLQPGLHVNIPIMTTRGASQGSTVFLMLYKDNGDGAFTIGDDEPLLGEGGAFTLGSFMAL